MNEKLAWVPLVISAVIGAGIWLVISLLTGKQEAWDSSYYFLYGLPLMAVVTGALGFVCPVRPWRWGGMIMVSQALIAILQNPMANLLPLGLVVFAVLSLPLILTAHIGAFIRNKVIRK